MLLTALCSRNVHGTHDNLVNVSSVVAVIEAYCLCCREDITTYTRQYVFNSTSHRHLVSTWDPLVQRKLCELGLNIDQEAVLRWGYLCHPCLSDLQRLPRDFIALSVNTRHCCWFDDGSLVCHCVCHVTWYCNLIGFPRSLADCTMRSIAFYQTLSHEGWVWVARLGQMASSAMFM